MDESIGIFEIVVLFMRSNWSEKKGKEKLGLAQHK
jgi:hypothetical protein